MSDHDVVVVGAGIAGLVVAHDLARAGHTVLVLTGGGLGGTIRSARLGDLTVDVGAEAFARRSTALPELLADLGLADRIVEPAGWRAWLVHAGGAAPLPENSWLGIPAKPWAADVRRIIGWRGALRASADFLLPPSRQALLADRVRSRMGVRVRDRLVAPVLAGVYSTPVDRFRVAELPEPAQQTLEAQRRLTAVARRLGSGAAAGAAVAGLEGGMFQIIEALRAGAIESGAEFSSESATLLSPGSERAVISAGGSHRGRAVVVATDGTAAPRLLGLTEAGSGPSDEILLCTVLLDQPGLNDAPRGSGVLVAPGTPGVAAKALTHSTAKWAWLAAEAGPGRHVVRLSYGRRGESPPPDADFPAQALADASRLLGVAIGPSHLIDHVLTRWPLAPPRDDRPLDLPHGVWTTGAWRAGTGLVAVVTAARATAEDVHAQLSADSAAVGREAGSAQFERKEG